MCTLNMDIARGKKRINPRIIMTDKVTELNRCYISFDVKLMEVLKQMACLWSVMGLP